MNLLQHLTLNHKLETCQVIGVNVDPDSLLVVEKNVASLAHEITSFRITCGTVQLHEEDITWNELAGREAQG